jgi:hypothetical protein
VACAKWIPETGFLNHTFVEPIVGLNDVDPGRWRLECYICHRKGVGACIQVGWEEGETLDRSKRPFSVPVLEKVLLHGLPRHLRRGRPPLSCRAHQPSHQGARAARLLRQAHAAGS